MWRILLPRFRKMVLVKGIKILLLPELQNLEYIILAYERGRLGPDRRENVEETEG